MGDDISSKKNGLKAFKLNPDLMEEVNQARQNALQGKVPPKTFLGKSSSFGNFLAPFMNNNAHLNDSTDDLNSDNTDCGLTMTVQNASPISNSVKQNTSIISNSVKQNVNPIGNTARGNSQSFLDLKVYGDNKSLINNNQDNFFNKDQEKKETFFNRFFKPDSNFINNKEFNVIAPSSH